MNRSLVSDRWERGDPYEQYVGRWSRRVAPLFLAWLSIPAGRRWLDVGCGTGALCAAIVDHCSPSSVAGVEPSEGFLRTAREHLGGRAVLRRGGATGIPLDEGIRFPLCQQEALSELFASAGLHAVEVMAIDIPTPFESFDDYWRPFLGGQGPAPAYAMSLDATARARLRDRIRARLPIKADGTILLTARAWAARATVSR